MRYVLGIVGIVLVLMIVLLLIIGGGDDTPRTEGDKQIVLSEQAKVGTSVKMTQQGRLVGETERRAVAITVSSGQRRVDILSGYDERIERSEVYENTPAAYETFLLALGQAGFSNKTESKIADERGACPLGRRFIYELRENANSLVRLWDTTCGNIDGTFGGDARTIRLLFQEQIPEYRLFLRGVEL